MVREAMVQVPVALLHVGLAPVFLPRLYDKVLQETVFEVLAGRDDLVVVPVLQFIAELELLRKFAEVPLRAALEVSFLQFSANLVQLSSC